MAFEPSIAGRGTWPKARPRTGRHVSQARRTVDRQQLSVHRTDSAKVLARRLPRAPAGADQHADHVSLKVTWTSTPGCPAYENELAGIDPTSLVVLTASTGAVTCVPFPAGAVGLDRTPGELDFTGRYLTYLTHVHHADVGTPAAGHVYRYDTVTGANVRLDMPPATDITDPDDLVLDHAASADGETVVYVHTAGCDPWWSEQSCTRPLAVTRRW